MNGLDNLKRIVAGLPTMYDEMAEGMPNVVWCRACGRSLGVNPAHCLRHGWPKCCGATMTIDQPDTPSHPESIPKRGETGDNEPTG